jgi:hypothetical protein
MRADIVIVSYADGSSERIERDTYLLTSGSGRVLERRRAAAADRQRLDAQRIAPAPDGSRGELKVLVDSRTGDVATIDRRGWREVMAGGTYELRDPRGNLVSRRPLKNTDLQRVRALTR